MTDDKVSPITRARAARATKPPATRKAPTPQGSARSSKPEAPAKAAASATAPKKSAPKKEPAKSSGGTAAPTRTPRTRKPKLGVVPDDARATKPEPLPAPVHLTAGAKKMWDELTIAYMFRPDELQILADACHSASRTVDLRQELRQSKTMVTGSTGQLIVNPLYHAIRQQELHTTALLLKLKLRDVMAPDQSGDSRSGSARAAAQSRWAVPHTHGDQS